MFSPTTCHDFVRMMSQDPPLLFHPRVNYNSFYKLVRPIPLRPQHSTPFSFSRSFSLFSSSSCPPPPPPYPQPQVSQPQVSQTQIQSSQSYPQPQRQLPISYPSNNVPLHSPPLFQIDPYYEMIIRQLSEKINKLEKNVHELEEEKHNLEEQLIQTSHELTRVTSNSQLFPSFLTTSDEDEENKEHENEKVKQMDQKEEEEEENQYVNKNEKNKNYYKDDENEEEKGDDDNCDNDYVDDDGDDGDGDDDGDLDFDFISCFQPVISRSKSQRRSKTNTLSEHSISTNEHQSQPIILQSSPSTSKDKTCMVCKTKFKSQKALMSHVNSTRHHCCITCSRDRNKLVTFPSVTALSDHLRIHHQERDIIKHPMVWKKLDI